MRQEAVDPTPGRPLEVVDVDVAALLVAGARPAACHFKPKTGLVVEREAAPQVLVLAVVAVVGLDLQLADVAAPVRDVELCRRTVAAVVLPQARPLLERPVRAVGGVASSDLEGQLRARVRLAAVGEALVVGHLALPAARVVATELLGPVDGAPVEDVALDAVRGVGDERDVLAVDLKGGRGHAAIDDLGCIRDAWKHERKKTGAEQGE